MSASGFRLEQVGGPALASTVLELTGRVLFGRGTDCQCLLPDAAISRRHAQIEVHHGALWLADLDSRSGTYLNDLRVDPAVSVGLNPHDRIRIGAWRFRVRSHDSQQSFSTLAKQGVAAHSGSGVTQLGMPILAAEARLELLVEFAAESVAAKDLPALTDMALRYAMRASRAERSSAWELNQPAPLQAVPDNFRPIPALEAFAAAGQGGVVRVDVMQAQHRCSVVTAIRVDGEAVGFIQLEFAQVAPSNEALELVHAISRLAGLSVAALDRRTAELRMNTLRNDLQAAHAVQVAILPPPSGTLPGLRYALHVHPGRVVAGDLVDMFAIDAHRSAMVLGDVSGAGFGAAMLMSAAQAFLHAELIETADPALAATRCNRYLARMRGGLFVTAWIAVFDARSNQLQVVDAGHGHARVRRADAEVVALPLRGGIPLAIDIEAQFSAESLQLQPAERLLLYSDGVAEHRNDAGQMFFERLTRVLAFSSSAASDLQAVLDALPLHGGRMPDDDATFMSIELIAKD
jgi:phosphoserine phosphatase RsbU/P